MKNYLVKYRQYFIVNHTGIVVEASDSFCNFTEYSADELTGNAVETMFSKMLRTPSNYNPHDPAADTYLFTKSLQARKVHIDKSKSGKSKHLLFQVYEIPNSRFENKQRYIEQLLSENVLGVGVYTSDLMLIKANQVYLSYLPQPFQTKEIAYGKHIQEMFPEFGGSSAEKEMYDIIEGRQSLYIQEKRGLMLEGDSRFWNNTITPVIENGEVAYLVSVLQDITERVLCREIIAEQKEKYETLLDNMTEGLVAYDSEGNCIHINQSIKDLREKYRIHCIEDETLYDVSGNEISVSRMPKYKVLHGKSGKAQRFMIKKDGKKIYFECSSKLVRSSDGKLKLAIINLPDATNTIENENKIKCQKEELDALLDNMVESLVIGDSQGCILNMNTNARRILGLTSLEEQQSIEKYFLQYELVDLDGNVLPLAKWPLARAMSEERFSNLELWLHYKEADKPPRLCSFSGTPVYNEKGKVIFSIITFKDITEQRMMQEKVVCKIKEQCKILSESMAFKDEFLYLITHEMKTPLAIISSALQTMGITCGQMPEKVAKYHKTIRQNTNRQLRLVNALLEIIKINSGKIVLNKEPFDIVLLTNLIVNSIRPIAKQKDVHINFHSEINEKIILLDEEKFERILFNLLSNALKFTPKTKEISVMVFAEKGKQQSMICISVRDEGIGIPKDKQSIIFERFGQANTKHSKPSEGTGIGLYLVKLLVDTMGGSVTLESEVGKGSTFTIMLPDDQPIQDAQPVKKQEPSYDDPRLTHEAAIQFSDIYL